MKETLPTKQIDPTKNVIELVDASIKRLDDLANLREKYEDAREKYIQDKIKDKDSQYQLQFASAKEAVGIALVAQEKAVAAALEGTREAINKADINTDKRFSLLSEKIDGITTTMNKSTGERGIYVTHSDLAQEMEKLRTSFEAMLRPVVTFMNSQTGRSSGIGMGWAWVLGGIGALGGITALVLNAIRLTNLGL